MITVQLVSVFDYRVNSDKPSIPMHRTCMEGGETLVRTGQKLPSFMHD